MLDWDATSLPLALVLPYHSTPASATINLRFNGGGHLNHDLFWKVLAPPKDWQPPSGALEQARGWAARGRAGRERACGGPVAVLCCPLPAVLPGPCAPSACPLPGASR